MSQGPFCHCSSMSTFLFSDSRHLIIKGGDGWSMLHLRGSIYSWCTFLWWKDRETNHTVSTASVLWSPDMRGLLDCMLIFTACYTRELLRIFRKTRDLRFIVCVSPITTFSKTDGCEGPFCQVSTARNPLPQGLRDPPPYSLPPVHKSNSDMLLPSHDEMLPAYSVQDSQGTSAVDVTSSGKGRSPDVLHFVDPCRDSLSSLSLRYGVPKEALRRINGLYADHLLTARRTILIPGEFYKGGVSLSPRPVDGEEEDIRKVKIRRLMVTCKVAEWVLPLGSSWPLQLWRKLATSLS